MTKVIIFSVGLSISFSSFAQNTRTLIENPDVAYPHAKREGFQYLAWNVCHDVEHYEKNPNYKDPAKSIKGIVSVVGTSLVGTSGVGGKLSGAFSSAAGRVQDKLTDDASHQSPDMLVTEKKCHVEWEERAIDNRKEVSYGSTVLTKEQAEKLLRDNPQIARPIGGGVWTRKWYNGQQIFGTQAEISQLEMDHYTKCWALSKDVDKRPWKAEHCDQP